MMDDHRDTFPPPTLSEAIEFVWREAELLDRRDYRAWLDLWEPAGHYVVPIDPAATDFAATLNYIYDDHDMRDKRVQRMLSGYSASATDAARTVRTVSRFTHTRDASGGIVLNAAQVVVAYKRGVTTLFAADVTHQLRVSRRGGIRIAGKVVRLIDSTEALSAIGFLL
jgi:3-phenylpropionate/cinnamic acid dioxygenase small subunit